MGSLRLASSLCLLALVFTRASCLTNRDFYEFLVKYGKDVRSVDFFDNSEDTSDDGGITLSGDLDDALDVTQLLQKMGLQPSQRPGFWHHHHHHHSHPEFHCSCTKDDCKCCVKHKFKFFTKKYELSSCISVQYEPSDHLFIIDFTMNGHTMYKHEVSLKDFSKLCYDVPGLHGLAKVCLELYDINLSELHVCARLSGYIDLKVHKFHVHMHLGCFKIPQSQLLTYVQLPKKTECLRVEVLKSEEFESRDSTEIFRKLQTEDFESNESEELDFEY